MKLNVDYKIKREMLREPKVLNKFRNYSPLQKCFVILFYLIKRKTFPTKPNSKTKQILFAFTNII